MDPILKELHEAWPSLAESHKQYIVALVRAAVDAYHGNMPSKDAKRFDRALKRRSGSLRGFRSMARLLVSLGYLPQGFTLSKSSGGVA